MKKILIILLMMIANLSYGAKIFIKPNKILIKVRNIEKISSYLILTENGKLVGKGSFSKKEQSLPIDNLEKGNYTIYLWAENKLYKQRFIINQNNFVSLQDAKKEETL